MYEYLWDDSTNGLLLTTNQSKFSKEPRPVYYKELDILGFDKYWSYPKDDSAPLMWAEANNYIYKGRNVAKTKGGSLYTKPEIVILEDPESNGGYLQFVDIEGMCEKNRDILETLVQETIQKIYNTYCEYKSKIDIYYVAFSGGKDSVVALDLVQRALPHDAFMVLFGDTQMEFPTTKELISDIELYCDKENIPFYSAKSNLEVLDSWDLFGPPARRLRWCCTVHKTAPVINKLCEINKMNKIHSMMITGVRGDESPSRSKYDELSLGKKLTGQHSFHPILEWSSAEVFLYTYSEKLLLNKAYKYGFNRVGCIMCPNSSHKHEYIKRHCFQEIVDLYSNKIVQNSNKDLSGNNAAKFLETGGWKTRLSGRELKYSEEDLFKFEEEKSYLVFTVKNLKSEWIIWYKTIGHLNKASETEYQLEYDGMIRNCFLQYSENKTIFKIENSERTKNSIEFIYHFKCIIAKTQYCLQCMTCVAECPQRCISMKNGELKISDDCIRCHSCLNIPSGCIYYNSVRGSNNMRSIKGVNRYLSVGVDFDWIKQYFEDQTFEPGNRKTDVMFSLMNDAGITSNKKLTDFGKLVKMLNINSANTWALILCNLAYSPAFRWYIDNIPFSSEYIESQLIDDMGEDSSKKDGGKKARGEFWNGFKIILDSNKAYREIGFGIPKIESKTNKNGQVTKKMLSIKRTPWQEPIPEVILYSLYKFAEACDGYYQFSLSELMNDTIERAGVSPSKMFGLSRETMIALLNNLSTHYPEFIRASFTLDLETITLSDDKKSEDVLELL